MSQRVAIGAKVRFRGRDATVQTMKGDEISITYNEKRPGDPLMPLFVSFQKLIEDAEAAPPGAPQQAAPPVVATAPSSPANQELSSTFRMSDEEHEFLEIEEIALDLFKRIVERHSFDDEDVFKTQASISFKYAKAFVAARNEAREEARKRA